jgi:ectoine hydroxylase-related dioxygenase (phytanoyl-CoA dioxygenase family)
MYGYDSAVTRQLEAYRRQKLQNIANIMQLNNNLQKLLKEYQNAYRNHRLTISNPRKTKQNRNNATARREAAKKAVINRAHGNSRYNQLLEKHSNSTNNLIIAYEIVKSRPPVPVYVQQPGGNNAVAFRTV